jgi:hypothetical protein
MRGMKGQLDRKLEGSRTETQQQRSRGTHTMGGGCLGERGLIPMNDLPATIFHLPSILEHVEDRAISVVAGGYKLVRSIVRCEPELHSEKVEEEQRLTKQGQSSLCVSAPAAINAVATSSNSVYPLSLRSLLDRAMGACIGLGCLSMQISEGLWKADEAVGGMVQVNSWSRPSRRTNPEDGSSTRWSVRPHQSWFPF